MTTTRSFRLGSAFALALVASVSAEVTRGPLTIHPTNPRWFADRDGRAVYLVGSHTWANMQDIRLAGDPPFDHEGWLRLQTEHQFNFQRLWFWEQSAWFNSTKEKLLFSPSPYRRPGPGLALDGEPKFDLDQFDQGYFDRLRARLIAARDHGVYCAVMLFQGFSWKKRNAPQYPGNPWTGHPFNAANNVNGFNGDADGDSIIDFSVPAVRERQVRYLRKVIDTVNDLDNVLYEVINEGGGSPEWQKFVVAEVQAYERTKPQRHLIGITGSGPVKLTVALASAAEWVSPGKTDFPLANPGSDNDVARRSPSAWNEAKPSVLDTDHIWGHGIDPQWVWKSFLRGHHVLFMDPWSPLPQWFDAPPGSARQLANTPDFPGYVEARLAMRNTARLATQFDLARLTPHEDLASTTFCLADPGRTYLVFLPNGGGVTVDLAAVTGTFRVSWLAAISGQTVPGSDISGGEKRKLTCPFSVDAVLVLTRAE